MWLEFLRTRRIVRPLVKTLHSITANSFVRLQSSSPTHRHRIAFISGHIDITLQTFATEYAPAIDAAIVRGDSFILSTARGTDTFALEYPRSRNVSPSQITVYLHNPRPKWRSGPTKDFGNALNSGSQLAEGYRKRGYHVKVIDGGHTARDAKMTKSSHYDILWIRPEADTALLYGNRYRSGRVSGTQKNRDRRLQDVNQTAS